MRLSWNEIRARANAFARDWKGAGYEKGETHSFYNDLFGVFGISRRSVATYEKRVENLDGHPRYIDLFWPGVLIVEQKSVGHSLDAADLQAQGYFLAIPEKQRPRFQLVCDFQTFRLTDLDQRETIEFPLAELPEHVDKMGFMVGVQRREFQDQDPVNAAAAHKMGELHDQLNESHYNPEHLNEYMVRTMFCLFGDDTGIFPRDAVQRIIEERTAEDGSDTGMWLHRIHQALGSPEDGRQLRMDEDLKALPHVGGLFGSTRRDTSGKPMGNLDVADYDAEMRRTLLEACAFDWGKVSPIVFGTMFEDAMDSSKRRGLGAHYTSEKNILKVIDPLFMDDLRQEFAETNGRKGTGRAKGLKQFHEKLGKLKFLDPACGCGNFLIVAYKRLRELEVDVIRARKDAMSKEEQKEIAAILAVVDVDQFHGIEIGEFPAKIAEAGLWMMDHVMNNKLSLEFGEHFVRIPIRKHPSIYCADALELGWEKVLPSDECDFVMGNPPFIGSSLQTKEQSAQRNRIIGRSSSKLDYVACWFYKAGDYIKRGDGAASFVSCDSICQGEQAAQVWPDVLDKNGLELSFAHQSFPWQGEANVYVIATGFEKKGKCRAKRLFRNDPQTAETHEQRVEAISPYLADASDLRNPNVVVTRTSKSMNGLPLMQFGTKPVDGGHLILTPDERAELLSKCPQVKPYVRPFMGGKEFLYGEDRSILHLRDAPATVIRHPAIKRRLEGVRESRATSTRAAVRELANNPTRFDYEKIPNTSFLVVPEVSSGQRDHIPIGYEKPPVIPSNTVLTVENASKGVFALLQSKMHRTWVDSVGTKLGNGLRYSAGVCYRSFPLPAGGQEALQKLEPLADKVLQTRANHPGVPLCDLYHPDSMPQDLRAAHKALDKAVDKMYRKAPFPSDSARLGHLLVEYEKMAAPVVDVRHEAQRSVTMKGAAKAVGGANAKRILSRYEQGSGKRRVRWRAGDALPGLFDRPAESVDPQAAGIEEDGLTS